MKRLIHTLLTLTAMIALVASCVKEPGSANIADPALGGTPVPVTFNLDLGFALSKADTPVSTALDDGTAVNKVFAAVFSSSDGALISTSKIGGTGYDETASMSGGKASVTITLAKGQDYKVVFFVQKDDTYQLEFADGPKAQFSYRTPVNANDPSQDAFWALVEVTSAAKSYDVTLKRPFAQLNVLVPADGVPAGKTTFSSKLSVKAVPTSFDLLAGKSGTDVADLTFTEQAISAPAFGKYAAVDGVAAYQWVGMNFLLVPASGKLNLSFQEKDMPAALELSGIPVKTNSRTNLVGSLYGGVDVDLSLNVQIDSGIGGGSEQKTGAEETEITIADGSTYTDEKPLVIDATGAEFTKVRLSVNGHSFSEVLAGAGDGTITASSADPSVATAKVDGEEVVITPVGNGKTVITVTTPAYTKTDYQGGRFKIPVEVKGVVVEKKTPVISVSEPADGKLALEVEGTSAIKASVLEGQTPVEGIAISYASSDAEVATVDKEGLVTALKAGEATITLTTEENAGYNAAEPVTIAVTVTEPEPVGDKVYKLVTSLSELTAGSEVLLVASGEGYSKALGVTQNDNNRAAADVTIVEGTITNPGEEVQALTLIAGAEGNSLAFLTAEGEYLYDAGSSSNNYLRTTTDATVTAAASFFVSLGEAGVAAIRSKGEAAKYIQYNATNTFFSCYAHTQVDPFIYKLEGSGAGAALLIPLAATPAISCEDNKVTITCATAGAEIFYTLDGTDPTTASFKYEGPFDITESCTVSAIAVAEGYYQSEVAALTCSYKGAESREMQFDFSDTTKHGLEKWPKDYAHNETSVVYQDDDGTAYSFGITSYIKMNSGTYGTYLMLGNGAAKNAKVDPYNQILTLPVIEGYTVKSIVILAGENASASAAASIQDAAGNSVVAKKTLAKGAETTFVIPDGTAAAQYRIYIEGTYNAQIAGLTLSLEPDGAVTVDPTVTTGGASAVGTTGATLNATFTGMKGGVRDYGFRWGTSASALTRTVGLNSSTQETDSFTATLSSLEAGATFYYQAYAIQEGTLKEYTGEVKSFTTEEEQSQTGTLPNLKRYEIPAVNLKEEGKYETGQEYYGFTNWYSYETTNEKQRVVMHTYAYGSDTYCNFTTLVDGTRYAPLWTAFEMSADYPDKNVGRSGNWTLDPAIPESWQQAGLQDANTVGYSRGHFCASNYRQTIKAANQQTFYYTNQAPQEQNGFNGSIWGSLEEKVKATTPSSSTEKLYVVVGVLYEGTLTYKPSKEETSGDVTITSKQVPLPSHFYKLLMKCTFDSSGKMTDAKGAAYLFTNEAQSDKDFDSKTNNQYKFVTSIDAIEQRTGFDFFASVPQALQTAAESNATPIW